ncbi:MAG TPA: NADH-quinone oxidoreductase subunit N [Chthoniobacterales bacterium]|nr:NADH-quinone oxidoreductase subunit N [Chthoniobacterales bacterium]
MTAPYLEIAVLVCGMAILVCETFVPSVEKKFFAYAGIVILLLVFIATFFLSPPPSGAEAGALWNFYTADALSIFFKRFMLVTTIVVLVMMIDYAPSMRAQDSRASNLGEFFSLPLLTCAGLMYLVSAIDFIFIFVALELVTISFFVLVSFPRRNAIALEAGIKYLILGALSTAFLVYGVVWIFGVTGETNLQRIADAFAAGKIDNHAAAFGAVLVLVGLGFKIAAVPFQMWVPDVYQGAPTPVTAFLSVGSKAAGFVVLLRVLQPLLMLPRLRSLIVLIALITVLYGNLAALPQNNLKRLLGYSSIAHAGYLLIGVACFNGPAVVFYLVAYLIMTLLSFAIMVPVAGSTGEEISNFDGLGKRAPFLAFGMLLAMASLAGVPFTAGFFGKFAIFASAVAQNQMLLVVAGVLTVACGFYYYLKVVRAMYWQPATSEQPIAVGKLSRAVMIMLMIATIVFGVYPQPIFNAMKSQPASVALKSTSSR